MSPAYWLVSSVPCEPCFGTGVVDYQSETDPCATRSGACPDCGGAGKVEVEVRCDTVLDYVHACAELGVVSVLDADDRAALVAMGEPLRAIDRRNDSLRNVKGAA